MDLAAGATQACAVALLLGLGLGLAQPAPQSPRCQISAAAELTQPNYLDTVSSARDSVAPFVHSFLGTVQPNDFPQELILKMIDDVSKEENIREALVYETGFLVCVAIGLVYIILMPLVGLIMACCRCCGNCGGKMQQEQNSFMGGRRRALYWCTFVITVIILAGNIIMFQSNNDFRDSLKQSPLELHNNLENVDAFLFALPQQLDTVVNESSKTVSEVKGNLDGIGPLLGGQIQMSVNGTLKMTVDSVKLMDQDTRHTKAQLTTLKALLSQLDSNVTRLKADVGGVRARLAATVNKGDCVGCDRLNPVLQQLTLDSLTVSTSSLDGITSAVDQIDTLDLPSKITEVDSFYNDIPTQVSEQTATAVTDSKRFLDDIESQLSSVAAELPLGSLSNVSKNIEGLQSEISKYTPDAENIDAIRWRVSLALCCAVLLVVACNFLGLLLGPIGLRAHQDPTKRSCTADCGGVFFMMSAGFSFIFSWLLMIVVVVLFLVGGNFYTLGCKPWSNGELLKFVDTQYELGPMLGINTSSTFSEAYRDCQDDRSAWATLHLNDTISLDELLDVSKYTADIHDMFNDTDVALDAIAILSASDRTHLTDFALAATALDLTAVEQEMDNIRKVDLNAAADAIDDVAAPQTNGAVKAELQAEAADLRKIQSWMNATVRPLLRSINSTVGRLQSSAVKINVTVRRVLDHVDKAHDFLNNDVAPIIKNGSQTFLDCQLGYFTVYEDWAKDKITEDMGRCGSVAKAVQSVETILCSQLVDAMNTFWFGLGWCLLFFIPSIILCMKLAKFYRRMKYTDAYEDD